MILRYVPDVEDKVIKKLKEEQGENQQLKVLLEQLSKEEKKGAVLQELVKNKEETAMFAKQTRDILQQRLLEREAS